MLSACILMTTDYRENILSFVGLIECEISSNEKLDPVTVWLRSAKFTQHGEGLLDKGFDKTDRFSRT